MSEWIRTADRVPDESGDYLVSADGNGKEMAEFYKETAEFYPDSGDLWVSDDEMSDAVPFYPTYWRAIRSPNEIARERQDAQADEGQALCWAAPSPIMSDVRVKPAQDWSMAGDEESMYPRI